MIIQDEINQRYLLCEIANFDINNIEILKKYTILQYYQFLEVLTIRANKYESAKK